jgi:hypothetical protein
VAKIAAESLYILKEFLSDLDYLINQNRQELGTPDESAAVAPET